MPINIYQTQSMLAAIQLLPQKPTFLRDRYFPTGANDIFPTEDVLVEYKDEAKRKIAPCVIPRKGGIPVGRDGYKTERMTPPYIAPSRPLTVDYLNKKGFGENLYSNITPEQRAGSILAQDIIDLNDMIDTREEEMAAQAMINNGYTLRHYADKYGTGEYEEFDIKFYDENDNPGVYTPATIWDTTSKAIIDDIYAMSKLLTSRGLPATDLIVDPATANIIINNDYIQKMLDNRRLNLIDINPTELPNGATSIGKINVNGRIIEIISYDAQFTNENNELTQFIGEGQVIMTAPGSGKTLYGAVTQLEQADGNFHTYMGKRVPHVVSDVKSSVRELTEKARPLLIPNYKTPWISAKVLK